MYAYKYIYTYIDTYIYIIIYIYMCVCMLLGACACAVHLFLCCLSCVVLAVAMLFLLRWCGDLAVAAVAAAVSSGVGALGVALIRTNTKAVPSNLRQHKCRAVCLCVSLCVCVCFFLCVSVRACPVYVRFCYCASFSVELCAQAAGGSSPLHICGPFLDLHIPMRFGMPACTVSDPMVGSGHMVLPIPKGRQEHPPGFVRTGQAHPGPAPPGTPSQDPSVP